MRASGCPRLLRLGNSQAWPSRPVVLAHAILSSGLCPLHPHFSAALGLQLPRALLIGSALLCSAHREAGCPSMSLSLEYQVSVPFHHCNLSEDRDSATAGPWDTHMGPACGRRSIGIDQ